MNDISSLYIKHLDQLTVYNPYLHGGVLRN